MHTNAGAGTEIRSSISAFNHVAFNLYSYSELAQQVVLLQLVDKLLSIILVYFCFLFIYFLNV